MERYASSAIVGGLHVKSSVDFIATYTPTSSRVKPRRVAAIVNPSGIRRGNPDMRTRFARVESELALRMIKADNLTVDECWYVDLPKESISERYAHTSDRMWANIDAACERIVEDFKRYRLQSERPTEEMG